MLSRLYSVSWGVAYRKIDEKSQKFHVVKNPSWGWAADPFLYEKDGKVYLFAELWEYRRGRAGLGYKLLSEENSEWKIVIRENYHLSYPNIMVINGVEYICPESCNDLSVYFYKAISFPEIWEKQEPIITGRDYSDTTFLREGKDLYGFTCRWHESPYKMDLFRLSDNKVEFSPKNPIITGGALARSGGAFLEENGKIIKVSQDCSEYYGKALVFSELDFHWPDFNEKIVKRVEVDNIELDTDVKPIGIHTYNRFGDYEVIDYKMKNINLTSIFWRINLKLKKIIVK